jgi:hypothetical protein
MYRQPRQTKKTKHDEWTECKQRRDRPRISAAEKDKQRTDKKLGIELWRAELGNWGVMADALVEKGTRERGCRTDEVQDPIGSCLARYRCFKLSPHTYTSYHKPRNGGRC